MAIEPTVNTIADLVASDPADTDVVMQGAAHLRNIKTAIKNTFPKLSASVTVTADWLNSAMSGTFDMASGDSPGIGVHYSTGLGAAMFAYGTPDNSTVLQLASHDEVIAEAARASGVEATLLSGTAYMGSGDSPGLGLHWSCVGAPMFVYGIPASGQAVQLALHTEIVDETARASNVEATLVSGILAMGGTDYPCLGMHFNSAGRPMGVYSNGSGNVYPTLALYDDVVSEAVDRTNAIAQLVPRENPNGATIYAGPNNAYWMQLAGNSGEFSVWTQAGGKVFSIDGSGNITTCGNIQTGSLPDTDSYQNCRWTNVMGHMTLSFVAIGTGAGGSNNNTVTFPKSFKAGTTPVVSMVIDREPGGSGQGVSRYPSVAGPDDPSSPVSNTGFSFQPTFTSGGAGTSSKPFRLQVIAHGDAP